MAKFSREQALRERRARKQEKKDDKKQAALTPDSQPVDEPLAVLPDGDPPIG
ncbi:MAG: hypothetical protein ABI927_03390 [Gaiellaceae bacterium]